MDIRTIRAKIDACRYYTYKRNKTKKVAKYHLLCKDFSDMAEFSDEPP
ncbi:hypothetical protein [Emticicia agri]|nr:hypothetical protein [Emticicia agri]